MTENEQISYNKVITKIQDTGITKFEFNCVKNALLKYENMSIEQDKIGCDTTSQALLGVHIIACNITNKINYEQKLGVKRPLKPS